MIERKRADAQLGGGQKRIDAQHNKVNASLCIHLLLQFPDALI
jgi:hypothetical protein